MVPQLHGTHRNFLDRAPGSLDLDILSDPKGVVDQEEDPRDDIRHELLRTEPDGDSGDPGASEQGRDVDAEAAQRDQPEDDGNRDLQGSQQQR